jgi:hypothetical protein
MIESITHLQILECGAATESLRRKAAQRGANVLTHHPSHTCQIPTDYTRTRRYGGLVSPLAFLYFRQSDCSVTLAYLDALCELPEASTVSTAC